MNPSCAVASLILQIGRQQPLSSLQTLIESRRGPTLWNMPFKPDKLHTLCCSEKHCLANSPIYFLNNPLEVPSLKPLGLGISLICLEQTTYSS